MVMSKAMYRITHIPANPGPGRYDESWTLDARSIGRGLRSHSTREAAQKEADQMFPRTVLTIEVRANKQVVVNATYHGDLHESLAHLQLVVAALEGEIDGVKDCPKHAEEAAYGKQS